LVIYLHFCSNEKIDFKIEEREKKKEKEKERA